VKKQIKKGKNMKTKVVSKKNVSKSKSKTKAKAVKVVKPVRSIKPVGDVTPVVARTVKTAEVQKLKAKRIRIELWCYDEYGQGSIVASSFDMGEIDKRAKEFTTDSNVENALALGEKNNQWEAFYPEITYGKKAAFYAGNKRDGKPRIYVFENDGYTLTDLPKEAKFRFYLGNIPKGRGVREPWYLADHKGNEITRLSDPMLERKTILFIKVCP